MAELPRNILAEQPVQQRGAGHQRQRPANGAAGSLERDSQQDDGDDDLEVALEKPSRSLFSAIQRAAATPRMAMIAPLMRLAGPVAPSTRINGRMNAMCSGRLTRLGTRPEKIRAR